MTGPTQFNATSTLYAYDNANRLTSLDNRLAGTGGSLAIYAYTLDANGNRTGIDQTVPLAITATPSSTSYTMNAKKNRLATTTAGTVTTAYTYDLEGQLATKTGETYTFDDAHRLAATAAGTVTNTYSYNGAGNRLEATRNGAVTRYVYDAGGNLLAEANSSNVIQKYYIYGDGLLAMVTSANALYCYHYDGTGHTVALTDASAAVVNKYAYTPFGKITNQVEAVAQPFKYAGKFGVMAEPNGNYYMRARYYDPSVGRFISEDPIGFGGGDVNLMAYVSNNPVMGVDPSGLYSTREFVDSIGGQQTLINTRDGAAIATFASSETVVGPIVFGSMAAIAEGLNISLYSDNKARDTIQACVSMLCSTNNPFDLFFGESINQANHFEDSLSPKITATSASSGFIKQGY